jgi:sugar phosphate isomerase/epimerase
MADRGVSIALLEGFGLRPGLDPREMEGDLDLLLELGGARINAVSTDRDKSRTYEGFARLTEMARGRGIEVTTEVGAGTLADLPTALEALAHVDSPNFKLLIDTMHYFRLGGTIAQIAAIDPELIGYVQLCDAPLTARFESYMEEALYERMAPGTAELPLREFIALLRPEVILSLEVPQRSLAEAGVGPRERVGACVESTRELLRELAAGRIA